MKQIEIYTDGSCKGNPGPGGWCAILLEKNSKKAFEILKGNTFDTTNNRMEMTAVIEALRYIDHHQLHDNEIILYSDSNLVIQTLLQGWKRKANKDLWEELDELNESLDIHYQWVKGHAKNYWNNECDKVAQKEADHAKAHPQNFSKSVPKLIPKIISEEKKSPEKKVSKKNISKKSDSQQELF